MKKLFKNGFTLIELLIVIAILGILAGFVLTNMQGARERARDVRRKSDLESISQALRLYFIDAHHFPDDGGEVSGYAIAGCGTIVTPTSCNWGEAFATDKSTYMNLLPLDPSSTPDSVITYNYSSDGVDTFALVTQLENLSDQDIALSQASCSTAYAAFSGDKFPTTDYVVCAQ